jgi:hypothetical protein
MQQQHPLARMQIELLNAIENGENDTPPLSSNFLYDSFDAFSARERGFLIAL